MDLIVDRVQDKPSAAVIHVKGNVDGSNYGLLIVEAQGLYQQGIRQLVLDLKECEYMSSAGLVALNSIVKLLRGERLPQTDGGWAVLHALDAARESGTQHLLALVSPTPRVSRVLDLAGMLTFLPTFPDVPSAVAALN